MTHDNLARFYQKKLGGIDNIIASFARRGISADAVREACAIIHRQHTQTPFVSTILLGQRLFVTAREVHTRIRNEQLSAARTRRQRIDDTRAQLAFILDQLSSLNARIAALECRHIPMLDKLLNFMNNTPYYG